MDNGVTERLYGNYRAKVVDNRDQKKFGRILIWIPDLMPDIPDNKGVWARPANNPLGGRNVQDESDNHYMGTSYIPRKGAWVFIFFESGNINRPYYFGALEIEHAKVLPENQVGTNYQDKWTIFKSHEGRTIVISDDPDDARVEITGKKRKLKDPPSGDIESVYKIDTNQTTILLDERTGQEKLLIRTHKGDFIHVDVENRKLQISFENDIEIKSNGKINITSFNDMNLKSMMGNINIQSQETINNKGKNINIQSLESMNIKSGTTMAQESSIEFSIRSGGLLATDGTMRQDQSGSSSTANNASNAETADPEGDRDI